MREVNPETITSALSWYKILPLNGFHLMRAKQNLRTRRKKLKTFLEPSQAPTVVYTENSMEFGRAFEGFSWNHRTSTRHRSLKEHSTSKGRCVSNMATIMSRWKDMLRLHGMLLLSAKCPRPLGRWENATRQTKWRNIQKTILFWNNGWVPSVFSKRSGKVHQSGKEILPRIFLGYELIAGGIWKRDFFDSRPGRFGKIGCIRYVFSKNQRKRTIDQTKRLWFHLPKSRWYSKIVRKRLRIPSTHVNNLQRVKISVEKLKAFLNQLSNLWHRDRLRDSLNFLFSFCLMRWLRQPWRSFSTRNQISGKEQVSKSSELKIATDSYEEDKLRTWVMGISVQPERMKQYKISQICSLWVCRMTMFNIFDVRWGSCTINSKRNAFRRDPGRITQVKITEFCSISDCDGIVWSRSCTKQGNSERSVVQKLQWNFIMIRWWEIIWTLESETMMRDEDQSPKVKKRNKSLRREERRRVFSVESTWTMFQKRFM